MNERAIWIDATIQMPIIPLYIWYTYIRIGNSQPN